MHCCPEYSPAGAHSHQSTVCGTRLELITVNAARARSKRKRRELATTIVRALIAMVALALSWEVLAMEPIAGLSAEGRAKAEARRQAGEPLDLAAELSRLTPADQAALASRNDALGAAAISALQRPGVSLDAGALDRLVLAIVDEESAEWTCVNAAALVARSAAGASRLQALLRAGSPRARVCAASGLGAATSALGAEERQAARIALLESLANQDDSGRVAGNQIAVHDRFTQRWLLDRLAHPDVAPALLERGLSLLAQGAQFPAERKALFLANLGAASASARSSAASGLFTLGVSRRDLEEHKLLDGNGLVAPGQGAEVRQFIYGALAQKPAAWMSPLFIAGLADPLLDCRVQCARALGLLRSKSALPALIALLRTGAGAEPAFPADAREAGAAIARIARIKGLDFSIRLESFPGGLKQVEQPEAWRKGAETIFAWWAKRPASH